MKSFRKNQTENKTANILWQYVAQIAKGTYSGSDNVLILNSKYKFHHMNKVTEMVANLNGESIRIECKYLSKNSRFDMAIGADLLTLNHCDEENILFVLDGDGFKDNKFIEALKMEINNNKFFQKTIEFVMLSELDNYISKTFNILPDWNKRRILN